MVTAPRTPMTTTCSQLVVAAQVRLTIQHELGSGSADISAVRTVQPGHLHIFGPKQAAATEQYLHGQPTQEMPDLSAESSQAAASKQQDVFMTSGHPICWDTHADHSRPGCSTAKTGCSQQTSLETGMQAHLLAQLSQPSGQSLLHALLPGSALFELANFCT